MRRDARAGFTILEVLFASTFLVVASAGIVMASATISRSHELQHQHELAEETCRRAIEQVQYVADVSFPNLYFYFDDDPSNDPEGPGTAPGNTMNDLVVLGLTVADNSPTGQLVEIVLHTDETEVNATLGLPRDLNGDGDADDADVSASYRIMPVTVRIYWDYGGQTQTNQMETLATRH